MARFVLFLLLIPLASAQDYTISTVAGIGLLPFGGAGAPAVNAFLIEPNYVATDSAGNTFVSDQYYQQVFRIDPSGTISVYAGNGQQGYSGDGGPANAAQLAYPSGLVVDSTGNLYIADNGNGRCGKWLRMARSRRLHPWRPTPWLSMRRVIFTSARPARISSS